MKILVTGGAGYIGSTVCSALLDRGHVPVILDSLVQGCRAFTEGRIFYEGDIADEALLRRILSEHPEIKHAIHLAGYISVPESVADPYAYYMNNVSKSAVLFKTLSELDCPNIIFSSTASVYGAADGHMVTESDPVAPGSPYGRTKRMIEIILEDFCAAYGMRGLSLRYFNPIGADPDMRTGAYAETPSHILGVLLRAAATGGVFPLTGVDWPTRDGSGIRDYIHVWDLAMAHIHAVERMDDVFVQTGGALPFAVINLGTGRGVTVREFVRAFETVTEKEVPVQELPPRPGDVAGAYANADTALALLGWKAELSLEQGMSDALRWDAVFWGGKK